MKPTLFLLQNTKLTGDQQIATYLVFLSIATNTAITIENFPFSNSMQKLLKQFETLGSQWSFDHHTLKIKTPLEPKSISDPIETENELLFTLFLTWFTVSKSLNTIKTHNDLHSNVLKPLETVLSLSVQKSTQRNSLYIAKKFNENLDTLKIKPHFLIKTCLLFSHLLLQKPLKISHGDWGENQLETLMDHFRLPITYTKTELEEEPINDLEKRLLRLNKNKKKPKEILEFTGIVSFPQNPFISISNDINLACFYTLMTVLTPKATIKLPSVCFNGSRNFFFSALKRMGAKIQIKKQTKNNDSIAQIKAEYSPLIGRKFTLESVKKMSPQIPFLILAGALAKGKTIIRDIDFLRQSNTDFLHSIILSFKKMGVDIGEIEDGLVMKGQQKLQSITYPLINPVIIDMTYWLINLMNQDEFSPEIYQNIINHYPQLALEEKMKI